MYVRPKLPPYLSNGGLLINDHSKVVIGKIHLIARKKDFACVAACYTKTFEQEISYIYIYIYIYDRLHNIWDEL